MSIAIHWFRRDLRLTDNTALSAACSQAQQVLPVFILSNWKGSHEWTGPARQEFLCGSLAVLDTQLRAKGGRLILRSGPAPEVLRALCLECQVTAIHFNHDPDPFGQHVEDEVAKLAAELGIEVYSHKDVAIHEDLEVLTASRTPFRVFTPYSKAWLALPKPSPGPAISKIRVPAQIVGMELPTLAYWGLTPQAQIVTPGEPAARQRLQRFLDGPIFEYGLYRDIPGQSGTSRLSQDLRHGLLSIREVYALCLQASHQANAAQRQDVAKFTTELIWREFYMQVLSNWPDVLNHEFAPQFRSLPWPGKPEHLEAWKSGRTGFPIVDAGMRALTATGFMHNRVRMIVAMFLVKDLHFSWKEGERYFMQNLVDGEIASNNGGWQWSAGTGTDAAPYFRIQNPWTQTKRYDPEGAFIKQWIPELRDALPSQLCNPPSPGLRIARGYPLPIVDHATERDRTLELYRQ